MALLSNGTAPEKGLPAIVEAHRRLTRLAGIEFIGNIEGLDIPRGTADVVVTGGFVGNVVLKLAESFPPLFSRVLREEVGRSRLARLGIGLARPALRRLAGRLDWESQGGAPLLGVDGACIICHGRSGPLAVRNAVRMAHEYVAGGTRDRIAARLQGAVGRT